MDEMFEQLKKMSGKMSIYYKSLYGLDELKYDASIPLNASGIIKLPLLVEVFRQIHEKKFDKNEKIPLNLNNVNKKGVLNYLHDGIHVTIMDLCSLMIITDDNAAADILINMVGMDNVNNLMSGMDLKITRLNSFLCEGENEIIKTPNLVSMHEIGYLLERIHSKTLISPTACDEMTRILKGQMFNQKIPFLLPRNVEIAHTVSEEANSTFDVAIVYTRKPFVLCFGGNDINVLQYTYSIQNIALELYIKNKNIPIYLKN